MSKFDKKKQQKLDSSLRRDALAHTGQKDVNCVQLTSVGDFVATIAQESKTRTFAQKNGGNEGLFIQEKAPTQNCTEEPIPY